MKPSFRDMAKLWWHNTQEHFLWSIVKRCVQRIDKMNYGAFLAFSWAIDNVTDYHAITLTHGIFATSAAGAAGSLRTGSWWTMAGRMRRTRNERVRCADGDAGELCKV